VLAKADLNALLSEARSFEAAGRTEDALVSLIVLADDLLCDAKTYQYVFEWMAQLQSDLGEHDAAERTAIVARKIAEDKHHGPGMFRMDVLRARIACEALELPRAEALLAGLRGDGPVLGAPLAERRDSIIGWLRALRFSDPAAENLELIQVELAVCIAGLWSERGKYESALALLAAVEPSLPKVRSLVNDQQFHLRQAELLLAAGRLGEATARLDGLTPSKGADRIRIAVVRTRVALAGGQLARALAQLDVLAEAPVGDVPLFSAATLARLAVLLEINRHETAQRIVDEAIARLTGAPAPVISLLVQAKRDALARQRSTLALWEQPYAAAKAAPDPFDAAPDSTGWRFTAVWTAAANRVFAALERKDLAAATAAHAELARCVRGVESELIACQVEMSAALIAYYRGTATTAQFLACAARFEAIGARVAMAQALRFASWVSARGRALDDYVDLARRASGVIDAIASELDAEHRALFLLNKWTGRDELASVLVRNLLRDKRDRPRTPSRRRLCRGFREVEQLTHWPIEHALGEPEAAALAADPSPDLALAWVRARLAAAPTRTRGAITLRWWPSLWWFPARTLVLHYHMMPDRTYLFRIARRHIDVVILPIGRMHLTTPMRVVAERDKDLRALAADLGIVDALARFPAIERLVIIPHDEIANAPFAALPIRDQRLCEIQPITQVDRLSRLVRRRPRSPRRRHLLCAGRAHYAGSVLPDLPGAAREVDAVLGALDCAKTPLREATVPALLAALPSATHLHLAAHGDFDPREPARSGIVLGDGGTGYATLTLHALRRLDLRGLILATLATCRSAEQASLPGHERVCLPTALLDAGARGVIASLWPVEDEPSVDVMTALYRELAHERPSVALAAAQAAMRTTRPAGQWAGLVFYGND
jgi:hypothetical protein